MAFLEKHVRALVVLAVLGVVANVALVASPYWVAWRLERAVAAGDADAVLARIDLPAIRAAWLERQRAALRAQSDATLAELERRGDTSPGAAFEYLGTVLGESLVETLGAKMLEGIVSERHVRELIERAAGRADHGYVHTSYCAATRFAVHIEPPADGAARTVLLRRDPLTWRVVDLWPGGGCTPPATI